MLCLHSSQNPAILFHNGTRHSALLPFTCCRLLTPFTARQNCGHGYAHCSDNGLPVLHCMDTPHGTNSAPNSWPETHSCLQPFVDEDHDLQRLFPPHVWAIRIPVILTLLASTVVGTFLAMVMIKSNRKKAAKARAAAAKKSK